MFNKVLIPLDGTETSEGILPYISQIAEGLGIPMLLMSVIDPDAVELPERARSVPSDVHIEAVPGGTGMSTRIVPTESAPRPETGVHPHETGGPYVSQMFERAEIEVKARLEEKAKELRDAGLTVETRVVFGKASEEIVRMAEREGVEMIAMSTHGRNALGRGILGSVADKVIHMANTPVMTITPDKAKEYWEEGAKVARVIVPLDGSPLAETALPYAEELAGKLSLEVMLVRTLAIDSFYGIYSNGYAYSGYAELQNELEDDATDYLKGIAERLEKKGLDVSWQLLRGAPAASIVELAHETSRDIIALTTHGRSGLTRWILGSVAEALIRASGDPVLVIPPPEEVEEA